MSVGLTIETCVEGVVQACGCIAIPEAVQSAFNLVPGTPFRMEVGEDGSHIRLTPLLNVAEAQQQLATDPRASAIACSI
jgi:hypothetical protein